MSFALKPINPKIQRVLEEKSKILSRDTTALNVQSSGMSNKLKEMQSRTSWIRWISGDTDPVVILGGVGINDGKTGYSLAKGFKQVYVPPDSGFRYSQNQVRTAGQYFKPMAGVKSITTSFEGATKALRKTIVSWTVFDLDELELLTPHFLSPGKWTMLEVGWNYDGKIYQNLLGNKFFEVKEETDNTSAKPKIDKFEDLGSLDEIIYANGGDYDVFTGIISNFEYSVRDDGGFDCTTTFTTHGISLLDAGKDTTTFTVDTAFDKIELTDDASLIGRLKQDNINIALQKLATYFRVTVTDKDWALKEENKLAEQFYGPARKESTNWFIYTGVKGKKIEEGEDFGGLETSALNNDIMGEDTPAASWVRWGWFEDNILSKYAGYATMNTNEDGKVIGINDVKLKFRSITDKLTTDPDKGTLGVKELDKDDIPIKESVRILSHHKLITTDVNKFILIGKTPSLELEEDEDGVYQNLGKFLKELPSGLKKYKFAVPKTPVDDNDKEQKTDETTEIPNEHEIEEGYIRNIFFNVRWLQEQFTGVGTLREALDNIWNAFNAEYQNYWQLDVVGDNNDISIAKLVDKNNSRYNVDKFEISTIDLKDDKNSRYGCYQFPTWTKDSIVSNMDYSVTIPSSQVAVAALSGGDLDANKIAQRNRGDIDVQTFVKSMHKSFKDSKERFFDNITRIAEYSTVESVRKFGNNSGEEQKELKGNEGPDIVGALATRDPDLTAAKIKNKSVAQFEPHSGNEEVYIQSAHEFFTTPPSGDPISQWNTTTRSLYKNGAIQSEGPSDYISVMLGMMHTSTTTSKGALTDLLNGIAEIKLTIDGTGGIFPGDAFTSKHLPNHLLKKDSRGKLPLLFQVTNVEQSISPDGWKTEITGQPRMNHNHIYDKSKADKEHDNLVNRLKGEVVAGHVTREGLLTRLFENRNILGINRKYLKTFEMFLGITQLNDDEYFGSKGTSKEEGTPFTMFREELGKLGEDGTIKWSVKTSTPSFGGGLGSPGSYTTTHTTKEHNARCTPANFPNRKIEEVMRFAMYNGILYSMPGEQTHNKRQLPYTSIDQTFQCVSYNLFKGDTPDMNRWEAGKPNQGANTSRPPEYTKEYTDKMSNDLNEFPTLKRKGGKVGNTGIEGLYTPMAILRRGKDIVRKFLRYNGFEDGIEQNNLPGSAGYTAGQKWKEAKTYQELFKFKKTGVLTVEIDWWPDKEVDIYNLKINPESYQIWFEYFKCMFDSYLGTIWEENAQLINHPTKDNTWIGDEESSTPDLKDNISDNDRASLEKMFNEPKLFKYGIERFSVDNEIHKFLKHMKDEGFEFSPELIWWNSGDIGNNEDWFNDVINVKGSSWDTEYAYTSDNASQELWPYEKYGAGERGQRKITYIDEDGKKIKID